MKKPETALKSNGARTVAGKIFSRWETFLVLIFLTVNIININLSPYYLNYNNLMDAMINFMDKGLMVYGTMMVLVLGEIDISIASIITLSACVAGWCGDCPLRPAFAWRCWWAHCAVPSTECCW